MKFFSCQSRSSRRYEKGVISMRNNYINITTTRSLCSCYNVYQEYIKQVICVLVYIYILYIT